MKQFRYKVVEIKDFDAIYGNILNHYGDDGWELVAVVGSNVGSFKVYYFKKEVELKDSTPPKLEG